MLKVILHILLLAVLIVFHQSIEVMGFKAGLPYTLATIIPYMLSFFAVCLIMYQVHTQFLAGRSLGLKRVVSILVLFGGCGIAFWAHPIYEGDFSHKYRNIMLSQRASDFFQPGLTMVVLPGCPYCHERLEELNLVSKTYPSLPIEIQVIHHDTISLDEYRTKSSKNITVSFFPDDHVMSSILHEGYPNFYYKATSDDSKIMNWSNDGFGKAAWDFIFEEYGI